MSALPRHIVRRAHGYEVCFEDAFGDQQADFFERKAAAVKSAQEVAACGLRAYVWSLNPKGMKLAYTAEPGSGDDGK